MTRQITPAVLIGQAIGDALGMPFEKLGDEVHPDLSTWDGQSFRKGTFHDLPPGHWTDDTEMAECLARSLIEHGAIGEDTAQRYLTWARGTPHGMGGSVKKALDRLAQGVSWRDSGVTFEDPQAMGAGTSMRAAPIGAYYLRLDEIWKACRADAYITHAHVEAVIASFAVAACTAQMMVGDKTPLRCLATILEYAEAQRGRPERTLVETGLSHALVELARGGMPPIEFTRLHAGRRGNAWQVTVTAIYCALYAKSFGDGVEAAVKLGGDADTRGAIAGAILGARFGYEGLPTWLTAGLHRFEDLLALDLKLCR